MLAPFDDAPSPSSAPKHTLLQRDADAVVRRVLERGPGPESVAELCALSRRHLSPDGRLGYITAWEQTMSWAAAQSLPAIVDHVGPDAVDPQTGSHPAGDDASLEQSALTEELRIALTLSPTGTAARVELARELCVSLTRTREELSAGRISLAHARAIVDVVQPLGEPDKGVVERRALDKAGHKTPGEFRRACRAVVDAIDPDATAARHQTARAGRYVHRWQLPDGMGCLQVQAPAPDIETIYAALSVLAGPRESNDPRTLGARRVDALLGLCLGAVAPDPAAVAASEASLESRPRVPVQAHVVIDLATLMGLAENPCELAGYGPIPAVVAHDWLQDATTWRRLVTDPVEGHLLDFGPVVRKAPPKLRDYLVARHLTCVFPGCHRAAASSDLDHEPPWRPEGLGGRTSSVDLRPLCRRHHRMKTHHLWDMEHFGRDGTAWYTPSGRRIETRPPPVLSDA
jgi:hypothetical protein